MFIDRTVNMIANPGKTANHQLPLRRLSRLSASIPPQVGTEGGTPSPRKDKEASVRMALATLNDAITMSGARIFGIMPRNNIRAGREPIDRAASTYSFSRCEIV